jgi:hypothetical protein
MKPKPRHSTVATVKPPTTRRPPLPPSVRRPGPPPKAKVGRLIDDGDASLLDVIDSLLSKGVVLNADIVLALANVDLVFLRLSALLCAADRLFPRAGK